MQQFRGSRIQGRIDRGIIENMSFEGCTFDNCSLGSASHPRDRMTVRNLQLKRVTQRACFINGAIIEEIQLHDLTQLGNIPLFFWAVAFKHVTLSGKLSFMKINNVREPSGRNQEPWDQANQNYYRDVDWAIDISKADFQGSISLEAIPGSLVRRDHETQVIVRRDRLNASSWRALDFGGSAYNICIDWFLSYSKYDDVVFVAPKKSRKFKEDLTALNMLRREGIAD